MSAKPKRMVSVHAERRFDQRYDGDMASVEHLANAARTRGICTKQIPHDNPLRRVMEWKGRKKDVRILEGYIFVFSKVSHRLITLYPIDGKHAEAYAALAPIEKANAERWKRIKKGIE